jgi:hypothetical protein
MRILLCPTSATDPSSRFRILQFVPPLKSRGYDVAVSIPRPGEDWRSPFSQRNKVAYWSSVYWAKFLRTIRRLAVGGCFVTVSL